MRDVVNARVGHERERPLMAINRMVVVLSHEVSSDYSIMVSWVNL